MTGRRVSWRHRNLASGMVVRQRRISDKSNEISTLRDLFGPLDLDGTLGPAMPPPVPATPDEPPGGSPAGIATTLRDAPCPGASTCDG